MNPPCLVYDRVKIAMCMYPTQIVGFLCKQVAKLQSTECHKNTMWYDYDEEQVTVNLKVTKKTGCSLPNGEN